MTRDPAASNGPTDPASAAATSFAARARSALEAHRQEWSGIEGALPTPRRRAAMDLDEFESSEDFDDDDNDDEEDESNALLDTLASK